MAIKGGVVSLSIAWHCNLDYDFMKYCLPNYNFRILDDFGWNFRHAKYHEENRRSLYKMYGIKVSKNDFCQTNVGWTLGQEFLQVSLFMANIYNALCINADTVTKVDVVIVAAFVEQEKERSPLNFASLHWETSL